MKNILLTCALIYTGACAQAQTNSLYKRLDKLEHRSADRNYDEFKLLGKKFINLKDSTDHEEKHILEFHPKNQVRLIEIIKDKSTQREYSNVFTGDVVRRNNAVSVRLDKLEGETMTYPLVYNLLLGQHNNLYYFTNINNRQKWVESPDVNRLKDYKRAISK
ncbi:hypothetical protein GNY06_06065 [Elizabethkingia argentiflava]|uniref:Uncharacterized protein n=1 Tax=Elizabethkingia argenteiflava TaxID=2681556 RepID=A0A845PTJ4_9FLAO|nr:hypothetical protein [Elizabethkingia argenteiflava]NAW50955.1 hypothetical protein [Elizabethkingia argenteiflava]